MIFSRNAYRGVCHYRNLSATTRAKVAYELILRAWIVFYDVSNTVSSYEDTFVINLFQYSIQTLFKAARRHTNSIVSGCVQPRGSTHPFSSPKGGSSIYTKPAAPRTSCRQNRSRRASHSARYKAEGSWVWVARRRQRPCIVVRGCRHSCLTMAWGGELCSLPPPPFSHTHYAPACLLTNISQLN